MFLSDLSIKRPVFATVIILSLVTLGIFSYRKLAIDMFPNVEMPILMIVTVYPGAAPESIERDVTRPIEEAVNPIAGVKHVMSFSREGVSTVVVEFDLEVRINDAVQEANAKISSIRGELPAEIEEPIIRKLDFGGMPIISLAVRSERLTPRELTRIVDRRIKRRLENLSGVGRIDLVGAATEAVNIEIDPARLEALGMGVDEVIAGIAQENVNIPLGRLARGREEFPVRIAGKPATVDGFRLMVIAERGGRPIALEEVARIDDGVEEIRSIALVDGTPAIAIDVLKQSGANTVEIVEEVKKEIERLRTELPAGVEIGVVRDGSVFIRDSVEDVEVTLVIGGLLAVFIVFLFLNSWRSTVITGLTLPVSVISSFIIMHFGGMTLNVLTLMALSLAIGMLIDDAIVVRENIVRHLEKENDHKKAAREGTSEIGLAIIATSLVIIAVFIPVAFMKGIIGRFFHSFGLTISFAVVISTLVAFTLDPMLSSIWHDPDIGRGGGGPVKRALNRFNAWFERTADRYRLIIGWALDRRGLVVALAVIAFFIGIALFGMLPEEFQTKFDQGEFAVNIRTGPQASLAETRERVDRVLAALAEFPEIELTYVSIGAGDAGTVRNARIYVKLVEKGERSRSQHAIQAAVRERMAGIAGIVFAVSEAGDPMDQRPVELSVRGDEIAVLKRLAGEIRRHMQTIPGIVDVDIPTELVTSEYRFTVDRERAADLGIMSGRITSTLAALVGGRKVSTFEDQQGEAREVRVRLPEALRQDPRQIEGLRIAGAGGLVPLGEILSHEIAATPAEINRKDLVREVKISADVDGIAIGTASTAIREFTDQMMLPPGYRVVFGGEQEIMEESFGYIGEALLLAILFVFLILAAQFESFIAPLAIMLSLPLSIVGMAGMLFLTRDTLNIMSQIGLIMLMGLVTKNAILLIDFAQRITEEGGDRRTALIEAGRIRLRPIIMTTLAMIFGMLPLFFALGAGAEMRAPMARAVVGGLLTSTVLTLIVVPVAYDILCDIEARLGRWWKGEMK
jgi:HAE1 family hydrophobic/amphiphilic exporter-1